MTAPGGGGADEIREQLAEEVSGWPLGGGYYQYTIGTDEAREIAAALLPTVQALIAKGAAAELEAAADGLTIKRPFFVDCHDAHLYADAANRLRNRAAALDGTP